MRKVVTILAIWFIFIGAAGLALNDDLSYNTTETYTISRGETLWGVVEAEVDTSGYDIRQVVNEVREINGLEELNLRPGDQVELPVIK